MIRFVVHDLPKPQGSKRHVGKGIMVESGGQPLRNWREAVKQAALDAMPDGQARLDGCVALEVVFFLPRPKAHMRTGRNAHLLRDGAPGYPNRTPDLDKLLRSLCDAMTAAGVWTDDARVVRIEAEKRYCSAVTLAPCAAVTVRELP